MSGLRSLRAGLVGALVLAATVAPHAAAAVITFDDLPGASADSFTSYSEDGFTVTATSGSVRVGKLFGKPLPSLYFADEATLEVTAGGALFSFLSWDHRGPLFFTVDGYKGGEKIYTDAGSNGFDFLTRSSGTTLLFDRVVFSMTTPDHLNATFDNFSAVVVPEPGVWAMLILGFGGVGALARRQRAVRCHA